MQSSSGLHFVALDHIRALAAFLVFSWHFTHGYTGYPAPFEGAPALFPLALLDEGHTGVAMFMTLSGFLFTKLLQGKDLHYLPFLRNRALRLLPLLLVVLLIEGVRKWLSGADLVHYGNQILTGIYLRTLPNGGWSITVEFHFYLLLPLLLSLTKKNPLSAVGVVLAAIALRSCVYAIEGEAQTAAYWHIFGRIDQFMLGMLAAYYQPLMFRKHRVMLACFTAFSVFYWAFDMAGGFYNSPVYPSTNPVWILMPTIEGLFYAIFIAWYQGSFSPGKNGFSGFVAKLGTYSYSIYLLHFFFVFDAAKFIDRHIMDISNIYIAMVWSLLLFAAMYVPGHLSFCWIEKPFLKWRGNYIKHAQRDNFFSRSKKKETKMMTASID